MKSILIRSFTVAVLASSISAFAAAAPAKDDPAKEEKTSMACPPAGNANAQMGEGHAKREKNMKKENDKKMKKDHDEKQDDGPMYGIYG